MSLQQLSPSLINLIRLSSALNSKDVNFFKQIDSDISKQLDSLDTRFVSVINTLLKTIETEDDVETELGEDDSANWKVVSDLLDSLFEKTEISLDEHRLHKSSNSDGFTYLDSNPTAKPSRFSVSTKPQKKFITQINNFESESYKPNLTEKPHALKSLQESLQPVPATSECPEHYLNPYSYEIMNQPYPDWILQPLPKYDSALWSSSEDDQPQIISTLEQLKALIKDLKKSKVIGVDLEHHDFRTYHGLTCLIQITSESKVDYILDPLAPEVRENLKLINEVFADPQIVKVLHGAFMDVMWLQRDFGVYIVSLFDTFHASKELMLGKHSLAFLLEKYVKFRTCKKYQLADWRVRPLGLELVNYAKADTHFLIEVFTKLQNELLKKGPDSLTRVLYDSRKVSNRRFEYSTFKPLTQTNEVVSTMASVPLEKPGEPNTSVSLSFNYNRDQPWTHLIFSSNLPLAKRPILELLFRWRDTQARSSDESVRYVMNDYLLVSMVTYIDINSEVSNQLLLNIINDNSKFSNSSGFIRSKLPELRKYINEGLSELQKMDVKKWNLALGIQEEADKITSTDNVYESVEDVEQLERDFASLTDEYSVDFKTSSVRTVIDKRTDQYGQTPSKKIWSVSYKKDGTPKQITSHEVTARVNIILDRYRQQQEEIAKTSEVPSEAAVEPVEEQPTPAPEEKPTYLDVAKKAKSDPNEIITLRKHQKHSKKRKLETDEDVVSLDLNKKVLNT
ncbi:unnamed protein product [Ambrosiozyma monospora]|uniref:Unnamed protein product n=1 Tax=Ambrosiozyma monospora TaxID=43982 RepID=A0A9W6YRE0_AMBMO|nr:unnamed protein product [Ambrosiozyma monospora]